MLLSFNWLFPWNTRPGNSFPFIIKNYWLKISWLLFCWWCSLEDSNVVFMIFANVLNVLYFFLVYICNIGFIKYCISIHYFLNSLPFKFIKSIFWRYFLDDSIFLLLSCSCFQLHFYNSLILSLSNLSFFYLENISFLGPITIFIYLT